MHITIKPTRVSRQVVIYLGTRWADGVTCPHLVAYFFAPGGLAACLAITLIKKIEQKNRKPRHVMLITNFPGAL